MYYYKIVDYKLMKIHQLISNKHKQLESKVVVLKKKET